MSRKTIVVVDDDLELHERVSTFFRPKGFEVLCFENASKAIEASAIIGRDWDVLLTDYHFPNMLAADFTKEIKANLPLLPVILITPLELAETAINAIENGAYDFIARPIHLGQLQVAVDRAIKVKSLAFDNSELRELLRSAPVVSSQLVGRSPKFLKSVDIAQRAAKSTASILLFGESGTGKEVFAKFIHSCSLRSQGPFIAINCASIPENLLESELFGHTKGSFTGASDKRVGLFEAAENGTLFLDEIGDLSLPLQAKLLRVLQEKKIKRVGENQNRDVNCRIISATHKDLAAEINAERFREDLFFRLNVIPITIPPLRERPEDVLPLAEKFLKRFVLENNAQPKSLSKEAMHFLLENKWFGNVRELENMIERAVVLSSGGEISLDHFMPLSRIHLKSNNEAKAENGEGNAFSVKHDNDLPSLDTIINKYIAYAVEKNKGARDKTAKILGIDRKTLYRRIQSEDLHSTQ